MKFNHDFIPANKKFRNYFPFYREFLRAWLDTVTCIPGVVGLVFLGGLGEKGYLDKFSDLDIVLYIDENFDTSLIYPFEFHHRYKNKLIEFNLRTLYLDKEYTIDWNDDKKEAYSHAEIMYDPSGRIEELLNIKTNFDLLLYKDRLVYLVQQYGWKKIHSERAQYRKFKACSHDLINECLDLVLEIIFILNREYRNHRKWRLYYMLLFKYLPTDFENKVQQVLITKNLGKHEFNRRFSALDSIFQDLLPMIKEVFPDFPENPYEYYFRKYNQPFEISIADRIVDKISIKVSDLERSQLVGFIALNFITGCFDFKSKVINNKKLDYKLPSSLYNKIVGVLELCTEEK